ncbi:MAG: [FeFe] hydrogenase H-cluster maturation GTPase HydF [Kiritimatiellia bacterium]
MSAPRGMRLQIGLFGRRNAGKSSLFNRLLHQDVAIVSEVPGTTTDPVERPMELQPIGPVQFIDTAGLDDVGALGAKRAAKSLAVLERVDVAILVADAWGLEEKERVVGFAAKKTPLVIACTKADRRAERMLEQEAREAGYGEVVTVSAVDGTGMSRLREALIRAAPEDFLTPSTIIGDLVRPGEMVVLVVPIDKEAPRGRLILPQVQVLRDILDQDACGVVVKERELAPMLKELAHPPALVVTDSQAFMKVAADTPRNVPMTSFSILFARFKGDLFPMAQGAFSLLNLKPGSRVLMAEACTHHAICDDIGRVKIPRWLEQSVGGKVEIVIAPGRDFPDDVKGFNLVIHCGGCMLTRREMLIRIERAKEAGIAITNYGLAIAACLGILDRALEPFPAVTERLRGWVGVSP